MSEKDGGPAQGQMIEPVAWMTDREPFRVVLTATKACMPSVAAASHCIPLYAASLDYAMGVADAARVCDQHARSNWNDDRRTQAKLDAEEIRALSAPPSVTEEWVADVILKALGQPELIEGERYREINNVTRATLAALGISVEAK